MPPTRKLRGRRRCQHPVRKSERYGQPTFAGLPRTCRHKIIENCSISTLLSLYNTCSNLRNTIPRSPTIVNKVFSRVYDFVGEPLPPAMSEIMAADPYLHPLFAKAIVESYDGYDLEDPNLGGLNGRYLVFLIHRCTIVHDIDISFSRARVSLVEGLRRKMALMAFWRMLDCIKNWTKDKKANGLSADISSEEYFGWCVDIIGGFKHMLRTEEERAEICETVGFFYNLGPEDLIKGWAPGRPWTYLGWRSTMIGFCLLGGLERVAGALAGQYFLSEMREKGGLEIPLARGISRWVEFERREQEKGRLRLEMGIELEVEDPSAPDSLIVISDDSDDDCSQPAAGVIQDEDLIELSE